MTGSAWTIREAVAQDAADIVAIIREAFPSELLSLFIYGCSGIAEFVAEQIAVQNRGGDVHYKVAMKDGKAVGCAEVRRFPNGLFLDYIAVRPEFRAQGLGRHLLRGALESLDADDAQELALDVLDFNTGARQWYARLGFQQRHSTSWREASSSDGRQRPLVLVDYVQSQACQRAYGFSRFGVLAAGQKHEVGRLGSDWYRLTDPQALAVPGLAACLKRLAPERRLLLLARTDSPDVPVTEGRELARSHRMVISLDALRRHLN